MVSTYSYRCHDQRHHDSDTNMWIPPRNTYASVLCKDMTIPTVVLHVLVLHRTASIDTVSPSYEHASCHQTFELTCHPVQSVTNTRTLQGMQKKPSLGASASTKSSSSTRISACMQMIRTSHFSKALRLHIDQCVSCSTYFAHNKRKKIRGKSRDLMGVAEHC